MHLPAGPIDSGVLNAGPLGSLSVPIYHSYPSASAKLYLDFDGDETLNWGGYRPGVTPAYDADGDSSTFSTTELSNIYEIVQRVAEKYSPFNIDVTTEDPGHLTHGQVMKVIIGGDGSNGRRDTAGNSIYWPGGKYGGIAWVGSFQGILPNVAFVFSSNLSTAVPGVPKYVAEATAHEAGHGFGLAHQSAYSGTQKTAEYSFGTYQFNSNVSPQPPQPGSKSPTMGNSYYADRGIWWSGPNNYRYDQIQHDLAILGSGANGFGLRPDGPNNTFATATPLTIEGGVFSAYGVIETMSDRDYFSFDTEGGLVSFLVNVAPFGAMLDATAGIYTMTGELIMQSATASLSEFVSADLSAGQYALVVSSAGNYGDVGQYFITGALGTLVPEPATVSLLFAAAFLYRRNRRKWR